MQTVFRASIPHQAWKKLLIGGAFSLQCTTSSLHTSDGDGVAPDIAGHGAPYRPGPGEDSWKQRQPVRPCAWCVHLVYGAAVTVTFPDKVQTTCHSACLDQYRTAMWP